MKRTRKDIERKLSSEYVTAQQEYKWEKLKDIIQCEQKFMLDTRRKKMTTRYQIQTLKGFRKNRRT